MNLDAAAAPGHASPPSAPRLEALHPRHATAIAALRADPAVARELPSGDLVAWIQASRARCAEGREQRFAVVVGDEVVGLCSLGATDDEVDGPTLSYWIGAAYRRRGLATAAAARVVAFAFGRLGARRLRAAVEPDNAPSRRVLAQLGFEPLPRRASDGRFEHHTLSAERWSAG